MKHFGGSDPNRALGGILRGVEKESLRVTPAGALAQTEHPRALGSALTHPHVTTDYSEALLEFITEPFNRVGSILQQLDRIHRYTYASIGDELLWPASMPCSLGDDAQIPVARYGSSNSGTMKTVYRLGLGHRYGRKMQTIAGVHYNFSLPDEFWRELQVQEGDQQSLQEYKTQRYFDLIRNFRRHFWLLIYLFGAAPAVSRSFVEGREHQLEPFGDDRETFYSPYATSLRMGDLGYQSAAQQSLLVCYNDLPSYLNTLCGAITRPHPDYQAVGVKDAQGHYQQLNTSLLQIENEFYSSVRPKRTTRFGETALQALRLRGVEYVEVRCVDLDPYHPLGIGSEQMHFMDAFLIHCLLSDSPITEQQEYRHIQENQKRIVYRGREPGLKLWNGGGERAMDEWARELLEEMSDCAALLDQSQGDGHFRAAVEHQKAKLGHPELTPSARILADMKQQGVSFSRLVMKLAEQHRKDFEDRPLTPESLGAHRHLAEVSLADQQALEQAEGVTFEEYLRRYYEQYRCCQESPQPC
ncbi:glutamate--cysteine ligase [Marinimicrobium sp. ABcell2]|uniref:glutamate--cysteine ligase n=1 Tax=Marinimicrobium sp. ABcell2 TaxID=3069751 RepID=UPI0027B317F3|nr:glutamate--cysteine ligase [Marinimicrobium sp. ABcell2]MDQ2076125.1 glutamate--cysteine ligase [Marinimicrobium sp. ABcell2]